MFKIHLRITAFLTLVLAASFAAVAQNSSPRQTVIDFYKFDRSHSQTFTNKAVEARKQWFSPALYALFRKQVSTDRKLAKTNPDDKPLFGDGLPFQPLDERCEAGGKSYRYMYRVGSGSARTNRSSVRVTFFYPKQCEPHNIDYGIELVRSGGRWLINDLIYEDKSTLSGSMKK